MEPLLSLTSVAQGSVGIYLVCNITALFLDVRFPHPSLPPSPLPPSSLLGPHSLCVGGIKEQGSWVTSLCSRLFTLPLSLSHLFFPPSPPSTFSSLLSPLFPPNPCATSPHFPSLLPSCVCPGSHVGRTERGRDTTLWKSVRLFMLSAGITSACLPSHYSRCTELPQQSPSSACVCRVGALNRSASCLTALS